MTDLIDCLGLNEDIRAAGFVDVTDFEAIYDELATTKRNPSLRGEVDVICIWRPARSKIVYGIGAQKKFLVGAVCVRGIIGQTNP